MEKEFIEIEVDGVKDQYLVKNGWNEVNILEWRQTFFIEDEWTEIRKRCATVAIMLTGSIDNTNWFLKMKPDEFNIISDKFKWLKDTNIETKESISDFVEIEGEKYYCINDFNTICNFEIEALEKISNKDNVNFWRFYNLLCCVFFRKKIEGKYEDFHEDFLKTRADLFDKCLISDIMSLFFFSENLVKM